MSKASYKTRHVEGTLKELARYFKIVLVVGARQVGKSTLLAHVFPSIKSIVFDPIRDIYRARQDPDFFLDQFAPPLILDEIQFAPELLPALKRRVDRYDRMGQYFLTGSQNLGMLRNVSESMSGRVAILELDGMTLGEMAGCGADTSWLAAFFNDPGSLTNRLTPTRKPDAVALSRFLWRGSLPGLLTMPDTLVPNFWQSYLQTYIERDVRRMDNIRDLAEFDRFVGLMGALTAQEINSSKLGREAGVSPMTARRWLDLLTYSYQWLEMFPYHGNTIKRLSGKRKGFLRDTGLACFLQRISSPEAVAASPLLGALFETWAVNDLVRHGRSLSPSPHMYHWRTNGGAEVDLILERDGRLYPVEMKCKTELTGHDLRGIRAFRDTYGKKRVAAGLFIYAGETCYRPDADSVAVPWDLA